jgi:hypothetical protein
LGAFAFGSPIANETSAASTAANKMARNQRPADIVFDFDSAKLDIGKCRNDPLYRQGGTVLTYQVS